MENTLDTSTSQSVEPWANYINDGSIPYMFNNGGTSGFSEYNHLYGYNKSYVSKGMTKKQQKARNKAKRAKQARKLNR